LYNRFFLGSILVFLPGFEDMSMVNKVIIEELIAKDNLKITIYMLHSMMQVTYTSTKNKVYLLIFLNYCLRHLTSLEFFNQRLKITKK